MLKNKSIETIIIGAGPIGLAMATRLILSNKSFLILEKGKSVGANILEWGHIKLFSNWKDCVDIESQKLINKYNQTNYILEDFPTGNEFVNQYLKRLTNLECFKNNIQLNSTVQIVNFDYSTKEFSVIYNQSENIKIINCKNVIDASGTWLNHKKSVKNQSDFSDYICHGILNAKKVVDYFQNTSIAILGNGHSAMNSIVLASQYSNANINWVIRDEEPRLGKSKVGGKSKKLEEKIIYLIEQDRIQLVTDFYLNKLSITKQKLNLHSEKGEILSKVDFLIQNIGADADYSFLSGIPLNLDNKFNSPKHLAKKINPESHTCDTLSYNFQDTIISEKNYYVIGMKSFGKASNFLLSSGYEILDELNNRINKK